jgi:XTP/dITP diphosphohydrolase
MSSTKQLFLASSNAGKLREFSAIARELDSPIELALLPGFADLPVFPEHAPTFAENAIGKALHAASSTDAAVCADDSGLVVPALDGAPGVISARYAGPNATNEQNNQKLLKALSGKTGEERAAHFVCALAVARKGRVLAVVTNRANGLILEQPRGGGGFGYDPLFFFPPLNRAFAEVSAAEKNLFSHRGKAFRRLLEVLPGML